MRDDVIIVGAGLAGLRCALALHQAGRSVRVFEAADAVGGRVRTDVVDGFRIDRGFQVLLTAYPEAQASLDLPALNLRAFSPGARIWDGSRFVTIGDPFRDPSTLVATALAPIGSLADKLRILRYRQRVSGGDPSRLLRAPDRPAREVLAEEYGFGPTILQRFLAPFFGGVFLEAPLEVSRRMADYTWRMFGEGVAAVPALGIGAIPEQLATRLPSGTIVCNAPVAEVSSTAVRLADGERVEAGAVVVATDQDTAARWLGDESPARPWRGVTNLAFRAPRDPVAEPVLVLNGSGSGPVSTMHSVSALSPEAAPPGAALISVSVIGTWPAAENDTRASAVRAQLRGWFGAEVDAWELLQTLPIPMALPAQRVGDLQPPERPVRTASGVFVCGDHRDQSSIQGAMMSGRRAADAILEAGR